MSLPEPRPGLVIRYSFLWRHEADAGAVEGAKDRPVRDCRCGPPGQRRRGHGDRRADHPHATARQSRVDRNSGAGEKSLGLDNERQWLCFDELNQFIWPGYDLRAIPGKPNQYAYGMLPEKLDEMLRRGILARDRAGKAARPINRD